MTDNQIPQIFPSDVLAVTAKGILFVRKQLFLTILTSSLPHFFYRKDERVKPGNLPTNRSSSPLKI
jgi:hypothetical protein